MRVSTFLLSTLCRTVLEIGESSTPATLENREDKQISLSLLSLPCDVEEALQQLIFNGELDLNEIDLTRVTQHEDGIRQALQSSSGSLMKDQTWTRLVVEDQHLKH